MINAEKLLGKILAEVTNSQSGKKKKQKKKYKQNHRSDDLISGLAGKLLSGKGLLTAVGLGVGAYTILKGNNAAGQPPIQASSQTSGLRPPPPPSSAPPIPPSASPSMQPAAPPAPPNLTAASTADKQTVGNPEEQALALRMIQVMIAAAYADGTLDREEEKEILTRLREADLDGEEKAYILSQFHSPKSVEELTSGINAPHICQTMYSLAVSSIVIDSKEERQWLDNLAHALGLSKEMQNFIEE